MHLYIYIDNCITVGPPNFFLTCALTPLFEAATFVQKRKRNMKDNQLNQREAMGDLLDAFIEVCINPWPLQL